MRLIARLLKTPAMVRLRRWSCHLYSSLGRVVMWCCRISRRFELQSHSSTMKSGMDLFVPISSSAAVAWSTGVDRLSWMGSDR